MPSLLFSYYKSPSLTFFSGETSSMNSSFSTFPPLNPVRAQRGYANHAPPLAHFSALFNRNLPETVVNIQISNNSVEQEPNPRPPVIADSALNNGNLSERVTNVGISNNSTEEHRNFPNSEGLDQSISIRDEGEAVGGGEREFEVEGEVEVEGEGASGNDPGILGINGQQITRLNVPILASTALRMVLSLVCVFVVVKQGKHIAKSFKLLFVVGSGIAFAAYSIISWINDRADNKMLKGLYHVGCNLAFFVLLFVIYTKA